MAEKPAVQHASCMPFSFSYRISPWVQFFGGLGLRQGFIKIAQICPKLVILFQPYKC